MTHVLEVLPSVTEYPSDTFVEVPTIHDKFYATFNAIRAYGAGRISDAEMNATVDKYNTEAWQQLDTISPEPAKILSEATDPQPIVNQEPAMAVRTETDIADSSSFHSEAEITQVIVYDQNLRKKLGLISPTNTSTAQPVAPAVAIQPPVSTTEVAVHPPQIQRERRGLPMLLLTVGGVALVAITKHQEIPKYTEIAARTIISPIEDLMHDGPFGKDILMAYGSAILSITGITALERYIGDSKKNKTSIATEEATLHDADKATLMDDFVAMTGPKSSRRLAKRGRIRRLLSRKRA